MKSFTLSNTIKPKVEKNSILEAINETINIEIKGNPDKFLDVQVLGKTDLIKEIEVFFKEQRKQTKKEVLNKLRKEHFHVLDLNKLGKDIELLMEYGSFKVNTEISPESIFSKEDYDKTGNIYTLSSLNNMPDEYKMFLNPNDTQRYFDENVGSGACQVKIEYKKPYWQIDFENKPKSNPMMASAIPYSAWLKLYKNFIASFIEGTANLVGPQNIKLSQNLTNWAMTGYGNPGE